jgi:hypothetical protein
VLATDGTRVLVERSGLELLDGSQGVAVRTEGFRGIGASFSADGGRVAVVLRRKSELAVAVVDTHGNAAIKPLNARLGRCSPAVSWDIAGRWIYIGAGDGSLYAVDAAGGYVEAVRTRSVGCGLAWLDWP